jgi:hypothetical protein
MANHEPRIQRLSELLPEGGKPINVPLQVPVTEAALRLSVGLVSRTIDGDKQVSFVINAPSVAPHIALMGAIAKGKTMTGSQIAIELVTKAQIPFLFIDPKGDQDVYHEDFRNSIAIDARIKAVSETLGLSFSTYVEHEDFYLSVAKAAGLNGWELDRLIFNFKAEFLALVKQKNSPI